MIHQRPPDFTRLELHGILVYAPSTGLWRNKITRNYKALAGEIAGCLNKSDGRWYLKVNGVRYSASRLAWFYMKGTWPKKDVEHWDGDKLNNKWANFRLATRTENQGNSRSRVPLKGVTQVRTGKYTAQIQKRFRKIHLGTFDTAEQAHLAYVEAAQKMYGSFSRSA